MPYISQEDRDLLNNPSEWEPSTAGELNYAITRLLIAYLGGAPNYQLYNDCLGALEGAKLELYRRRVAPYEDQKIQENGDVY